MSKPKKPKGSPLTAHSSGQWCKKIRGKLHYFGVWADHAAALAAYYEVAEDLHAGRDLTVTQSASLVMGELCNEFISRSEKRVANGELSKRALSDYMRNCRKLLLYFGAGREVEKITMAEWSRYRESLAKKYAPTTISNEVTRTGVLLNFAYKSGLVDREIRTGTDFARPPKRIIRRHRRQQQTEHGLRLFSAAEIHTLIDASTQPLTSMLWLAINGAFGQNDLSEMPRSVIGDGWIDYPRPKTENDRRCVLWPETAAALEEWAPRRPKPLDESDADCVFLTKYGRRFVRTTDNGNHSDNVAHEMTKLLKRCDLVQHGRNFYAIRHTFQTVAGLSNPVAVSLIMGHVDPSMAAIYREKVDDSALIAVSEIVRKWLFNGDQNNGEHGSE